jgi:hypothetical protein
MRRIFAWPGNKPRAALISAGAGSSWNHVTVSTTFTDKTMIRTAARAIASMLCAALLSGCAVTPPSAEPPILPPDVFGVYQDNDVGALNLASSAFAAPRRILGDPIDAARAVIAVEYMADELRRNPRWIGISAASTFGMVRARTDTRRVLGIAPDAPPQQVVNALLRFIVALEAGDQAAALATLSGPAFTLPAPKTLQILYNLPYIQSANQATLQAANEQLAH